MTLNFAFNRKFLFAFTLIYLLTFQLIAQEKSEYSLLWKIEGKDLIKPSYLFGTMHVNDERAFNFSDAVLPAIQNTEKFALEIQPDSLVIKMFSKPKNEIAYLQFKKILNDVDYAALANRFREINGYDIEDTELYDPNILLSMLSPDDEKSTDKATFVDMHLLGHAKTMQKEIIGLEDIDSQLNYFENATEDKQRELLLGELFYDIKTYKAETEALKKTYITGDLNAIDEMIMSYDGYGQEMEDRNIVMTNSIVEQMKNSSLFSAVGAAHLPGSVGLIKMLRDKGYTVTKVEANFTGVTKKYTIDTAKMKWHKFTDNELGYSVETPGITAKETTEKDFNAYIFTDLLTGTSYSYFALDFRTKPGIDKEVFYQKMIEDCETRYDGKITSNKRIKIDGISGYKVIIKTADTISSKLSGLKTVFVFKDDVFYQYLIFDKFENLNSRDNNRFINSIKLTKPRPLPQEKWFEYVNKKGAFYAAMPSKPIDRSRDIESPYEDSKEPYRLNMYMAIDAKNKSNYIIRYNDQPTGYVIEDLDAAFESMAETFTGKAEIIGEPKVIYQDGYIGKQYEMFIKGISHSICKLFFRGNRIYLLLSQKIEQGLKTDPNNRFFTSFKFTDFEKEKVVIQNKNDISFKSFEKIRLIEDEEDYDNSDSYLYDSVDYYTKNEASGDMYSFGYAKLKPYFKIDTLKNFYELNKENIISWTDTIINSKTVKVNNQEGIIFTTMKKKDSILSKYLLWLYDDIFFYTAAYTSKENIDSKITKELLYSHIPKNKKIHFDYYSSKTNLILNDLKSKDSLVFKQALGAFSYYEFDKTDLLELYKSVDSKYANEGNRNMVMKVIVDEFNNLTDKNSLQFLEKLYSKYNLEEDTKREIIKIIPKLEDKNSLAVYKNLLFNNPPKASKGNYNYSTFSPFFDSIPMAIKDYKSLMTLNNSLGNRSELLGLSTKILNSEKQNKKSIVSYFDTLTKDNKKDLQIYLDDQQKSEEYNYTNQSIIYTYLNYFGVIPKGEHSQTIDEFTQPIISIETNKWMKLRVAQTRIHHDLELEKSLINSLLDSLDTSFSILKAYHNAKKLNVIPRKYYKEEQFAELSINQFLEEVDEWPTSKNLLGKITINGIKYYAYALVFDYEDDTYDYSYLGLVKASFKVSQANKFVAYEGLTDWKTLSDDWKTQAKELVLEKDKNTTN